MLGWLVGDVDPKASMEALALAILLDGQRLKMGAAPTWVAHETDCCDKRLNHVDLLQRRDDEQLQPHALEQPQGVSGGLVRTPAECLVDDDEPEGLGPPFGVELELV